MSITYRKQLTTETNMVANINGNGSTELAARPDRTDGMATIQFDRDKIDLLKRTFCAGATDDEFELFVIVCKKTGLDPFTRQIYAIKRWNSELRRETITFQTGIDGYRLTADRTNRYMPGPKPVYTYDASGNLLSATAFIKKWGPDNQWHMVDAEAFFEEYAARKREGDLNQMWASKPHVMIAKCAEALALRKAFPNELSGVYTKEEMDQADSGPGTLVAPAPNSPRVEFIAAWDEVSDSHGITHKQGRTALAMLCSKRKIKSPDAADNVALQSMMDEWRSATPEQIQKIRQVSTKNGKTKSNAKSPSQVDQVTPEQVATWEMVEELTYHEAVELAGVPSDVYAAGLDLFRGDRDPAEIPVSERIALVMANRDGRFDWATGTIAAKNKAVQQ